jgi:hypothetical protein
VVRPVIHCDHRGLGSARSFRFLKLLCVMQQELHTDIRMARAGATFRQHDITRALRAVAAAGIEAARVEIDPSGKIVIQLGTGERVHGEFVNPRKKRSGAGQSLSGRTPGERSGQPSPAHAVLDHYALAAPLPRSIPDANRSGRSNSANLVTSRSPLV